MSDLDSSKRQQLVQAIQAQENLRGLVDDAIVDMTIASLQQQLNALEEQEQSQQRKQVTVIFMDVVGSTTMIRDMDPEENLALMDNALQRLSRPVTDQGGRVLRYMGDGFMAVFGLPKALENDPEMAVRAGLGILQESRTLAQELEEERNISNFQVRVGINTGLVATGGQTEADNTIMGSAVHLAARLESAAPPGGMIISHFTHQHVQGIFELQPHEPIQAKGFADPVPVYVVVGVKPSEFWQSFRGVEGIETPMIGRKEELQTLKTLYTSTLQDGQQYIVTISGEAGLGKSRLLLEFEHWINHQPQRFAPYHGRARLATRRAPYSLLRDLLANRFTINDDDPVTTVCEKIQRGCTEVWGPGADGIMKSHIIGQFLGFDFHDSPHLREVRGDPQQLHDRALIYLVDYFQAVSEAKPLLFFIEDLHWADDSSLDLLLNLLSKLVERPYLMVSTTRPVLFERRPNWGEKLDNFQQIDLQPLSEKNSRRLIAEVLQKAADIPTDLHDLVVSNAEGNPFYVEELLKMLIADGVIVKTEPYWQVKLDRLAEAHIPPTLTGVLQARLDSLPTAERELLQQAAVVGRIFWDILLTHLSQAAEFQLDETRIDEILYALRQKELIFRRGTSTFSGAHEHIFKHAILHDVTYESVLKRLRRIYHALVAEWLREQSSERSSYVTGLIADHLHLAGNDTEAFDYYQQASEAARLVYANEEAIAYLQEAIALLPSGAQDSQLAGLQEQLGDLLGLIGRFQDADQAYRKAIAKLSSPIDISRLYRKLSRQQLLQKQLDAAPETLDEAEEILGYPRPSAAVAHWREWLELQLDHLWLLYWRNENEKMETLAWQIEASVEAHGTAIQRGLFFQRLAMLSMRRDCYVVPDETIRYARQSLAYIEESGTLRQIAIAHFITGFSYLWHGFHGDLQNAEHHLQTSLALCEKIGDFIWKLRSLNYLSVVYRRQGLVKRVRAIMPHVLAVSEQQPMNEYISASRGNLAWVAWQEGDLAETLRHGLIGLQALEQNFIQTRDYPPLTWIVLWPLLAAALELENDTQAVYCARLLIQPGQMLLPLEVVNVLQEAIDAWEKDQVQLVRDSLEKALQLAHAYQYI